MAYLGLRGSSLRIVISLIAATAFALQGYDQALMNGLVTLSTFDTTFPKMKDSNIEGTTVAIYEVGSAIGAFSCAFIGNILGRRYTIFTACCVCLVGIILQATPFALGQLITARVITGLGVGALTATVPMWVAECSNANERGRRVLIQGSFVAIGTVTASWLEFGLYFTDSPANWRFPIAFQAFFILIVTSLVLFLPESPRWLIMKDRIEEAERVISALEDLPADDEVVKDELALIRESYLEEQRQSSSIFAMGPERQFHRAVLAVGIAILAQMSGINIVTFYSDTVLEQQLHYSATTARIFSGCIQIWQLVSASFAVLLIDRFGRRKLLLFGALGMCIVQAALTGLMSTSNKDAAKASIFFYFAAMTFFPIGLLLIPFMYAAEIAPLSIRHKVTAIGACANWLFNFLVAEVTPHAIASIKYRYYIVYACINAFSVVVIYLFCPETKGRTLEEVDDFFIQSKSVFDTVKVEKTMPRNGVVTAARIRDAHASEKETALHMEGC
ncbi:hypothetical protein ASPWEDRAFT_36692 [Aspergillus wentii DTO 134E9]|uniref:Major facilitator superfamily (MFS) profile domain-containing protein n=1 Tax=Aspergillus wentii DTO 134E9 TaxID=1073089 RepID=A0A1L9RVN8_ASPWE|nr:uncharacterized protein ASPWEDRAFT_36692 [Aspergillus wentii DTO 134E9]KAI9928875.1 hypothetical protein MW887_002098 [Aspergillus wentii]OJJ38982.1 hypothetical protein ASPWEDRAFT_36692 [Aspergillus wentii DTO 134E9]